MLDNRPVRNDLTSRECANLLGAFLGGLAEMAPLEAIREAVKYYAEHDDPWAMLEAVNEALKSNIAAAKGAVCICGHGAQAHANSATECNGCMCPEFKLDYLSVLP